MTAPIVIRRRTTVPVDRSSRGGRSSPPSNRMSATDIDTIGNSVPPRKASGSTTPPTGPSARPATSSRMIDGTWVRQASHWAAIPTPTMTASVGPMAGFGGSEQRGVHEASPAVANSASEF